MVVAGADPGDLHAGRRGAVEPGVRMPHPCGTALLAGSWHGAGSFRIQMDPVCCLPGQPRLIALRRDREGVDPVEARLELADAARRAFDWIGSVAVDADGGLGWLEGGVLVDDLYSGTAGVLLGCAEAAAAGLGTARVSAGARARLLHLARHGPGVAVMPDDGLFCGWAGVAVALRAWSRVAGDAAAASAAAQVTSRIAGRIVQAPAGRPQCTDVISGDAGILLALIADDSGAAVRAAHVLAGRLAEAAEPGPGGFHWRMAADWEYLMPGFSHECVRYFVRGGFSLSGSGCLSVTVFSRYLMSCCPVYPAVPRNRTFRAVPGLMLRVPVFPASCAVAGACCLILRGSHGRPFPSVIKYSRR